MRKIIAFSLLCTLLLSLLVGCSSPEAPDNPTPTSEAIPTATEEPIAEPTAEEDTAVGGLCTQGYTFRICNKTSDVTYVYAALKRDTISTAIYTANREVMEKYGIKIENVTTGTDDTAHNLKVYNSVMSGEDAFDMVFGHDILMPQTVRIGRFLNLLELDFPLEEPWWASDSMEDFTAFGKCYLGFSSISYMGIWRARILLSNNGLLEEAGLEVPYEDISAGTWTLEKMIAMTDGAYADLNQNGQKDDADRYGFVTEGGMFGFMENFNLGPIGKTEDGLLVNNFTAQSDKVQALLETLYDWMITGKNARTTADTFTTGFDTFNDNRLLFGHFELSVGQSTSGISYSILPMPKYDEQQEDYITSTVEFPFAVPVTVPAEHRDEVAVILNAMSQAGYELVTPVVFEQIIGHTAGDIRQKELLELIASTRHLGIGYAYANNYSLTPYQMFLAVSPAQNDFSAFYTPRQEELLDEIVSLLNTFYQEGLFE